MRALVNAVVVAFFIVPLYLLYSWLQSTVGCMPSFIDWLGVDSPLVVLIGGVGFNLLAVIINLVVLAALAAKPSLSWPRVCFGV